MSPVATSRLPLGTTVQDNAGRIGDVFDYGLNEDESLVYYLIDGAGEWKTDAVDVQVMQP